jgi:hypothetical protein
MPDYLPGVCAGANSTQARSAGLPVPQAASMRPSMPAGLCPFVQRAIRKQHRTGAKSDAMCFAHCTASMRPSTPRDAAFTIKNGTFIYNNNVFLYNNVAYIREMTLVLYIYTLFAHTITKKTQKQFRRSSMASIVMVSNGWFSGKREEQLALAKTWKNVLTTKATVWGVPDGQTTSLDAMIASVEQTQAAASATRMPIQNA